MKRVHHQKIVRNAQGGFGMVELILGIGLSALVLTGVYSFFKDSFENVAVRSARETAIRESREIGEIIKRDYSYKKSFTIVRNGEVLNLVRSQSFEAGASEASYSARFKPICNKASSIPGAWRSILSQAYSGQNRDVFAKTPSRCIYSSRCRKNEVPGFGIDVMGSGDRIPAYPRTSFPSFTHSLSTPTAGTAVCFQKTQDKLRIVIESAYLSDMKTGSLGVVTDEILLADSPFPNIEIVSGH